MDFIPYAMGDFEPDGSFVRVCPECGERIPQPTDATGEDTADTYGDHYEAHHA